VGVDHKTKGTLETWAKPNQKGNDGPEQWALVWRAAKLKGMFACHLSNTESSLQEAVKKKLHSATEAQS